MITKAVILARGLGTRMRKQEEGAALDEATSRIASTGVKAMIPTLGRPFLDFVLSTLADAGYRKACLVIGPEHTEVREYYGSKLKTSRIEIDFAIQEKPLGTGDAVRPAEKFSAGEPFLMINSDNFYPHDALRALHATTAPAIAVFEKNAMLAGSNIASDRISKFSVVRVNPDGTMKQIIEKPDDATLASMGDEVYVSMNFQPQHFQSLRRHQAQPARRVRNHRRRPILHRHARRTVESPQDRRPSARSVKSVRHRLRQRKAARDRRATLITATTPRRR